MFTKRMSYCIQGNERSLLIPTKGFGILQRDLIKNIGIDRMKSFFFNYGWSLGEEDAKNVMDNPSLSFKEKILCMPHNFMQHKAM